MAIALMGIKCEALLCVSCVHWCGQSTMNGCMSTIMFDLPIECSTIDSITDALVNGATDSRASLEVTP